MAEEQINALEQAFSDYRQDLENYEKKRKPTDGLLGFGSSLKDDPCHERLDQRVERAVSQLCSESPSPEAAERVVRFLLSAGSSDAWPLAAQWMLCAIERHSIPLIPFLAPGTAEEIKKEYTKRYRPWERLPVQNQVVRELKYRSERP